MMASKTTLQSGKMTLEVIDRAAARQIAERTEHELEALRERVRRLPISQRELARRAGITHSWLSLFVLDQRSQYGWYPVRRLQLAVDMLDT